ncbi:TPA: hypothetical protein ACSPZB_001930, partial [Citrobacter freundii]
YKNISCTPSDTLVPHSSIKTKKKTKFCSCNRGSRRQRALPVALFSMVITINTDRILSVSYLVNNQVSIDMINPSINGYDENQTLQCLQCC